MSLHNLRINRNTKLATPLDKIVLSITVEGARREEPSSEQGLPGTVENK
jgi:hypothetical protein